MDQFRPLSDTAWPSGASPTASRRTSIEHELARPGRSWSFAEPLEADYVRSIARHDARGERLAVPIALVLQSLWLVVDYVSCPDVWDTALVFRLFVTTPLLLLAARVDTARPLLRGAALLGTMSLLWMPTALIYMASEHATVAFSYLAFPLSLVFVNLTLTASFRHTIMANVVTVAIYVTAIRLSDTVPLDFEIPLVVVIIDIVLLTLITRLRLERARRQAWLLLERDKLRVEDWKDRAATLSVASSTDPLTGAANRRAFDAEVTRLCLAPTGGALILLDLDNFKHFNDAYGHPAGDACLRRVVEIASRRLRSKVDRVARYGGEEFALILPGCALADAKLIAEHLRVALMAANIRHPTNPGGVVTGSFGVAVVTVGVTSADDLLAAADHALYAAKAGGRNRVHPPVSVLADEHDEDDVAWVELPAATRRGAA
jgi:diguanylate cyclase (GGDEF)-like protein